MHSICIYYRVTFVQNKDTFWVRQSSAPLWDGISATPTVPTAPTGPIVVTDPPQLSPVITSEQCGKDKGCYSDCKVCQYTVAVLPAPFKRKKKFVLILISWPTILMKRVQYDYSASHFHTIVDIKGKSITNHFVLGVQCKWPSILSWVVHVHVCYIVYVSKSGC